MPRPRCKCNILGRFKCPCFKPVGVSRSKLESVELAEEEHEALRLKDLEGLSQAECAKRMNVSQPTFHRMLTQARGKVSDAIINGKTLELKGKSD